MLGHPILHFEFAIMRAAYASTMLALPRQCDVSVLREEYAPSRIGASRLFNADFSLWFLPDLPQRQQRTVEVVPVRPHLMGAEYFVTVRNDGAPALIELIGGESIPVESFSESIRRVNAVVTEVLGASCENLSYLRLAELATGVAFLAATVQINDVARLPAERRTLTKGEVFTRRIDGKPVMMDGFLDY